MAADQGADAAAARPSTDQAVLQRAYESAFQEMLRRPADLDLVFRYAELAIRLENYEAAIAALERLLLFNPDLPRVRLELGALYYRLGSYDLARSYLVRALESEAVPEPVRHRARTYLDEIDERTARHRIDGAVLFGGRWQSNANAGPASPEVRVFGGTGRLDDAFTEQSDANMFLSARATHSYDLGTQWPDERFETTATGYFSRHEDEEQLDAGLLELASGPRFALLPDFLDGATIRPYSIANYVWLDDESYFRTLGAGLEADYLPWDRLRLTGGGAYLDRDYNDTRKRPNAHDRDGHEWVFDLGGAYALTPTSLFSATVGLSDESLHAAFASNREYRLFVGYTKQYQAPFGLTGLPWVTTLSAGRIWTDYDASDPLVDPTVKRSDREWRLGVATDIGLAEDWSLIVNLQRFVVDSNLPNYEYDNWSATVGAAWSF